MLKKTFTFWALLVVAGAVLLGPASLTPAAAKYLGAEVCKKCHLKNAETWLKTKHAFAYETLEKARQQNNQRCLICHTVGFGQEGGFTTVRATPELKGVQCENCHGPGGDHVIYDVTADTYLVKPGRISVGISLEVCAKCHAGEQQFRQSAHAGSLELLRAQPDAKDYCLDCHSADRILAKERDKPNMTLKTAQHPITCPVCHNPHDKVQVSQLRLGKQEICVMCHTGGQITPGVTPFHYEAQMHLGVGGVGVPPTPSVFLRAGVKCPDCHIFAREYREGRPKISGHLFLPSMDACVGCHSGPGAVPPKLNTTREATEAVKEKQKSMATLAASLKPKIEEGGKIVTERKNLSPEALAVFNEARLNYEFATKDPSSGFHNSEYARKLLGVSDERITKFLNMARGR